MKGSYVLITNLLPAQTIRVGSLGKIYFPAGRYAYVGSAMGGFKSRLPHHFRKSKKPRWHIDYLLQKATISSVVLSESLERNECTIAKALMKHFQCIVGFGSSDCKCKGHLFFLQNRIGTELRISTILASLGYPNLFPCDI
jgi:Uri superfamily endonuclease